MSSQPAVSANLGPTHFLARNHDGPPPERKYGDRDGQCCFCGYHGPGQAASDVINYDYFNDDDLMQAATGHVCAACAYCIQEARSIKIGHWLATPDHYERVSTGDLLETVREIQAGAYDPPLAFYVAKRANISQHAYLWTPLSATADPLTFAYARRSVTIALDELLDLVDAVETLRRHGFRLDDIRTGRPRVRDLDSIGRGRYRAIDAAIDPYRQTATLETALTLSRAKGDQ